MVAENDIRTLNSILEHFYPHVSCINVALLSFEILMVRKYMYQNHQMDLKSLRATCMYSQLPSCAYQFVPSQVLDKKKLFPLSVMH